MRNKQQKIVQECVAYSIINNFDCPNTRQCETIIKHASVCSLLPLTCANSKICSITDYNCCCQELEPMQTYSSFNAAARDPDESVRKQGTAFHNNSDLFNENSSKRQTKVGDHEVRPS